MNKILIAFVFIFIGMSANAQYVSNLDEIELLGTWNVTDMNGEITIAGEPETITSITFNDGKNSYLYFDGNTVEAIQVYTVGGTATGCYTLHLLKTIGYDGYHGLSSVNFEICQFGNNTMTLRTYDKNVTIKLKKQTASSVSSVEAVTETNDKTYTVDGVEATVNTKGIVIQDGKKHISR